MLNTYTDEDEGRESDDNTAVGYLAMSGAWASANKNDKNTAIGSYSMDGAMIGANNNTGCGYSSLGAITSGDSNVGIDIVDLV
jgi:hypothetical protein